MNIKFGISQKQFYEVEEALSYQNIYDLSDEESELAFALSHLPGQDLKTGFKCVWLLKKRMEEK